MWRHQNYKNGKSKRVNGLSVYFSATKPRTKLRAGVSGNVLKWLKSNHSNELWQRYWTNPVLWRSQKVRWGGGKNTCRWWETPPAAFLAYCNATYCECRLIWRRDIFLVRTCLIRSTYIFVDLCLVGLFYFPQLYGAIIKNNYLLRLSAHIARALNPRSDCLIRGASEKWVMSDLTKKEAFTFTSFQRKFSGMPVAVAMHFVGTKKRSNRKIHAFIVAGHQEILTA